ncbi:MAG: hypothetical protein R3F15_13090 [Lysobacterales bacterium]
MARMIAMLAAVAVLLMAMPASAQDQIHADGFEPVLPAAPTVQVLRDDRVATVEMDYNADNPWGQFWEMSGDPHDDAGFVVVWWPESTASVVPTEPDHAAHGACLDSGAPQPNVLAGLPPGASWLVTGNRRVQLQPLDNDRPYRLKVARLNALGELSTQWAELGFAGGNGQRVAALRSSMTFFDDFNLPLGPTDERNWNNAQMVSTDERFNLFFINGQLHTHTVNGTRVDNTGDKSQTTQRFRHKLRLAAGAERRIVFDMDSLLSPRSVWYLDLNPISADLTGHASFFDEEGALGLPAGILRLRAQGQSLSVSIVDLQGASHRVAAVDMEGEGRQAITNVRRSFDLRVRSDHVRILVDGRQLIDAPLAPYALPPADYELLWVDFGYNTPKDGVPYFLHHWDNFGFDGPVVDDRITHNYVTRIAGTDYQKAARFAGETPTFSVQIPDDLRPLRDGDVAEAWLVWTYQMGDFSQLSVQPGDTVQVNGSVQLPAPAPVNNTNPSNPDVMTWGVPHTVRVKLGDLVRNGSSPLQVGTNQFRFNIENAGLLNVHVEVLYPPGGEPAYTHPAAIHPFPLHSGLPQLGPPARLTEIGAAEVGQAQWIGANPLVPLPVSGVVPLNIEVGNGSWANWARQLMRVPVSSVELWAAGGTEGIAQIEVFLRPAGSATPPGQVVAQLATSADAPAPQGRYRLNFNSTSHPNGDYLLYVRATTPSGRRSHPSYGNETYVFDAAELSGAYYPIPIRIQN